MNSNSNRTRGIIMGLVGLLLLLLNALDYLLGWNSISSSISVIGIVFAVIGAGMVKRARQTSTIQ
jgi:hypothetical protein